MLQNYKNLQERAGSETLSYILMETYRPRSLREEAGTEKWKTKRRML